MIQSMTGFSEKRFHSKTISARMSIRSLNHRYFDWSYKGAQIGEVENRLRAICQKKVHRGKIEVFLELHFLDQSSLDIYFNEDLLEKIISSLEKISSRAGKNLQFSVESLMRIPQVINIDRKDFREDEIDFLERSFERTLTEVLRHRKREGMQLGKALRIHAQNIGKAVERIEKLARKQPLFIRDKLRERLKELMDDVSLSEDRLIEEAAYYAQRYDLAEEIERLKSHLHYIKELLSPKMEEPVGRKLDFVAQELYRETNTISSKSQDIEIIKESLEIKGEIESIRQQIQNIE